MWELLVLLGPEMAGLALTPAAIVGGLLLLNSPHPVRYLAIFGGAFLISYAAISILVISIGGSVEIDQLQAEERSLRGWMSVVVGVLLLFAGIMSGRRSRPVSSAGSAPTSPTTPRPVRFRHPIGAGGPPHPVGAPAHLGPPGHGIGNHSDDGRTAEQGTDGAPKPQASGLLAKLADPTPRFVLTAGLLLALLNPNIVILASGLGVLMVTDLTVRAQWLGVLMLLAASMIDFVLPALVYVFGAASGRRLLQTVSAWLMAHNRAISAFVLIAFGMLFSGRGLAYLLG